MNNPFVVVIYLGLLLQSAHGIPTGGGSTVLPRQNSLRNSSESPTIATDSTTSDEVNTTHNDVSISPEPFRYFTIPPIPLNARDVHEIRIVELIPQAPRNNRTETNGSNVEDVESRAGAMGPVLAPTDVRPEDSNLGMLGYHELLDRLWMQMKISRSCILYNNFDAIRGCDCQACLRSEPDFRTQLCAFGRAVRNSSDIEEYILRTMGPQAPLPREVFMLEDYYVALCDLTRCPRVPNRCCNPAFNPGVLRRPQGNNQQLPHDFYQLDASGCPACHPVVPLGTPLPSLDRSCILEELLSFAPLPPLSLPTL